MTKNNSAPEIPSDTEILKPIVIPPLDPTLKAIPGLLAGFSRTFLTNLTLGVLDIFRNVILWWFKVPIKMFRPYAVNPWSIFSDLAEHQNQSFGPTFIRDTIKKEGWGLFRRNVLPLMIANGIVGAVLFNTYTVSHHLFKRLGYDEYYGRNFFAGSMAGMAQTLLSTPLDNVTKSLRKEDALENRHKGIHHVARNTLNAHPEYPLARRLFLYRGLFFNMCRDSLGFGMFFGVFEGLQRIGKLGTHKLWQYPERRERPWELKVADGLVVISAGAVAGAAFQLVVYPLDRLSRQVRLLKKEHSITTHGLTIAKNLLQQNGFGHYYRGVHAQLIRAMPPSAIGLFVYEISSDWIKNG